MILCSMAKKDKKIFHGIKREFNNIIITVKDNCLDTKNAHTHTFLCLERNNRQDKGKGISFLIY